MSDSVRLLEEARENLAAFRDVYADELPRTLRANFLFRIEDLGAITAALAAELQRLREALERHEDFVRDVLDLEPDGRGGRVWARSMTDAEALATIFGWARAALAGSTADDFDAADADLAAGDTVPLSQALSEIEEEET